MGRARARARHRGAGRAVRPVRQTLARWPEPSRNRAPSRLRRLLRTL